MSVESIKNSIIALSLLRTTLLYCSTIVCNSLPLTTWRAAVLYFFQLHPLSPPFIRSFVHSFVIRYPVVIELNQSNNESLLYLQSFTSNRFSWQITMVEHECQTTHTNPKTTDQHHQQLSVNVTNAVDYFIKWVCDDRGEEIITLIITIIIGIGIANIKHDVN